MYYKTYIKIQRGKLKKIRKQNLKDEFQYFFKWLIIYIICFVAIYVLGYLYRISNQHLGVYSFIFVILSIVLAACILVIFPILYHDFELEDTKIYPFDYLKGKYYEIKNKKNSGRQISIIFLIYNDDIVEIEKSMNSLLSQTYKNLEIIIISRYEGECSILETLHEKYRKNKNINVLRTKDRKLKTCLNAALDFANGYYISLFESGNIAKEEKLLKEITFLENEGYDFISSGKTDLNSKGKATTNTMPLPTTSYGNILIKEFDFISLSCVMFKKKDAISISGFREFKDYPFYDLWIRLKSSGKNLGILREELVLNVHLNIFNEEHFRKNVIAVYQREIDRNLEFLYKNIYSVKHFENEIAKMGYSDGNFSLEWRIRYFRKCIKYKYKLGSNSGIFPYVIGRGNMRDGHIAWIKERFFYGRVDYKGYSLNVDYNNCGSKFKHEKINEDFLLKYLYSNSLHMWALKHPERENFFENRRKHMVGWYLTWIRIETAMKLEEVYYKKDIQ